jgi:hypothetical protein
MEEDEPIELTLGGVAVSIQIRVEHRRAGLVPGNIDMAAEPMKRSAICGSEFIREWFC